MLTRRIIPCLDVKDGRVVKGINFVSLRDAGDPVEQARAYDEQGADEICFLDISASPEGKATIVDIVARTADCVFAPLTVGGGVRTVADVQRLLEAGADKVSINTAALEDPELVARAAARFGSQAIVVAVDAKARPGGGGWTVYTHGGRNDTGKDAIEWCRRVCELGAGEILLTSMDTDGTGKGYDRPLIGEVVRAVGVPVIASGGAGSLAHLADALDAGADAVLAATIFHYGEHTIDDAKQFLAGRGIPVRR